VICLLTCIWNKEKLPEQWKESIIVPIYKKGDKPNCSNYRGISLLSTSYNILSNILLNCSVPCCILLITNQIFPSMQTVMNISHYWLNYKIQQRHSEIIFSIIHYVLYTVYNNKYNFTMTLLNLII
jgi:hypothetical protein